MRLPRHHRHQHHRHRIAVSWLSIALFSTLVSGCKEPIVGSSVVYDPVAGQALYFGGASCASPATSNLATASNYICAQPCNGKDIEFIDAQGHSSDTSSIPPPSNFQCCALDSNTSQMLCIGGVAALDLLYRFDVRKSMWIPPVSVPNGLAQRSGHSCAVSKGFFYVLGGISLGGFDVSVPFYSFNVGTQAFTSMPTPPFANRYGHQLVTLPDGNLFVGFGALVSSSTSLLDSWTFNVITQSWASLPTTNSLSIADGSSCTPWSSSANSVGGVFCFGGVTTSVVEAVLAEAVILAVA
ncbi:hypothetical protein BCR33DRAFT_446428 [Rhizoclosmatium globosum]|uniref:Galactose oxidase n=1 Tax=Rhizoclosmatium globosum TaxID=329046 RepID=A0A1Y2BS42_9FUNG|nr:hypothetical protein BCR33DRAFT_446428 [Rhizoclosmatium globosum]|eukprot:ORY37560.1 hypothetical protein BCR33DRAFT_446428 [Rhizoclosmatium globosum]